MYYILYGKKYIYSASIITILITSVINLRYLLPARLELRGEYNMADLEAPFLYGKKNYGKYVIGFSLQIHITAKCDQRCKHCYMFNSDSYQNQIRNPLKLEDWTKLIDEYHAVLIKFHCSNGMIGITGGDPLLCENFWPLLEYINKKYPGFFRVVIMGNPYHVDDDVAKRIKDLKVHAYQISIDGMQEMHDYFRKPGSFQDSLRALQVLHRNGIHTVVGMTISKTNAKDIISLFDFLNDCPYVDEFGFDRMVPTGNGKDMADAIFTAEEYRQFLFDLYKHEVFSRKRLTINKNEKMWRVLFWDLGLISPYDEKKQFVFCEACGYCVSILADGTMMTCRKLNIVEGKYPDQSLEELYCNSKTIPLVRNPKRNEKCEQCGASSFCNGCPAMKFAMTGDINGKEMYCWK